MNKLQLGSQLEIDLYEGKPTFLSGTVVKLQFDNLVFFCNEKDKLMSLPYFTNDEYYYSIV